MFERIKKHFALKGYLKKLGPMLEKRYGKSSAYTPQQVKSSSRIVGLNDNYIHYGYALFCMEDTFNEALKGSGIGLDYQTLRQELGDKYFDGNCDFNAMDVNYRGSQLDSGFSFDGTDGGGFSAGDFGGCDGGGD